MAPDENPYLSQPHTRDVITPAAKGEGNPRKYRLFSCSEDELNLAKRNAVQAIITKLTNHPTLP